MSSSVRTKVPRISPSKSSRKSTVSTVQSPARALGFTRHAIEIGPITGSVRRSKTCCDFSRRTLFDSAKGIEFMES